MTKQAEKRNAVFDTAANVFSNYGFRRTSMNDIAQAAGISRPALYLMFENKEDLFRQLATHRQDQAIDEAVKVLVAEAPLADRIIGAMLAYQRVFYEPVAESPHGEELMDINQSLAGEDMRKRHDRLVGLIARALEEAVSKGEANFSDSRVNPKEFAELLMSSIGGLKKTTKSAKEFRRRIREVGEIFIRSIAT